LRSGYQWEFIDQLHPCGPPEGGPYVRDNLARLMKTSLEPFLTRFEPSIRTLVRAARAKLRKRVPTAIELVYDNANALAIAFSSSERGSDTFVSLAVYARGVNLYFIYGIALDDPDGLLQGSGNQGRFVRLENAAMLDRPEIEALIAAAIAEGDTPLPRVGRGRVVLKSAPRKPRRVPAPK
jgi:hypothetical protein